ncbi:MAG: hypothetical protein ACRDZ5_07425 [Acidimicrobiales bacterium]
MKRLIDRASASRDEFCGVGAVVLSAMATNPRPVSRKIFETVAFRCTGKRLLPLFLASFAVPTLAIKLKRE